MKRQKIVTWNAFWETCGAALCLICLISGLISFLILPAPAFSAESEKWPGVDEAVVEKIAKEHGRAAMTPLINTDQGDLLLFAFLTAGAVGGFAAGYSWRKLTEPGRRGDTGGKPHEGPAGIPPAKDER
jgi:hypothetical protein